MLTFVRGNLLESPAQALVNTVNTEGVMGKGIALQFRRVYPEMYTEYRALCDRGDLKVGTLHVWRSRQRIIINFPTKTVWRKPSDESYIRAGLATFVANYEALGISSVAFPPLGCGNGELNFERQVRPLMEEFLRPLSIPVYLYAPIPRTEVAEHRSPEALREWLRGAPHDMPFSEVWADLRDSLKAWTSVRTFATKKEIEARVDDEGEFLGLRWDGGRIEIPKVVVQETWARLQSQGMIRHSMVPAPNVAPLLPVLALLPYVAPVRLATSVEGLEDERSWGVQLVPVAPEDQRKLALSR